MIGRSSRNVRISSISGDNNALKPKMNRILTVLVPAMLPIARESLPCRTAPTPTANSGTLVPTATMVRPMTIGGMPTMAASLEPAHQKLGPAGQCGEA